MAGGPPRRAQRSGSKANKREPRDEREITGNVTVSGGTFDFGGSSDFYGTFALTGGRLEGTGDFHDTFTWTGTLYDPVEGNEDQVPLENVHSQTFTGSVVRLRIALRSLISARPRGR